ncbi:hypothetical protein PRIPAC_98120 [Pristionchus pacificus]|uniref:Uncharacterized protein n=1 Tax=Pristionchus pacificus TaxID=54126 RepID=A0A2A6BYU8_PRIPA|nr:hypothetical protein PRIPAC_98120 [Pristionchus pacificus]|eukprot:PDM71114.1 hypothetical protein PRIPAC_38501 [Pristionchus pacificus]
MKMSIVISTLENPETHGFRKSEFLSCAKPIMICPILRQMAAYILEFLVIGIEFHPRSQTSLNLALLSNTRKSVFDVTSSGINWRSTLKMKMSIVISTLENPETHGFRKSEFLSCAKPIMICPILRQMAAYILEFRSNSEK